MMHSTHPGCLGAMLWIGVVAAGCLSTPKVPQTHYDIQALVQQQAQYLHEQSCEEHGYMRQHKNTTPALNQPRSADQWVEALEMLGKLDLNQAYTQGGYLVDTLYIAAHKRLHYRPVPYLERDFDPKIMELIIEEDSSSQELRRIYGKWAEKKYLYHLSYELVATFAQQRLETYHVQGFEKIGWYDTLWYEWRLDCHGRKQLPLNHIRPE